MYTLCLVMLVTTLFIYSTYFFRRNKKVLPITTPDDGKGTEVASNEEQEMVPIRKRIRINL